VIPVSQGEHLLPELNDSIGVTILTGVPPMKRTEAEAVCRLEYTDDGILQFSACETRTNATVKTTFKTKTEFTDADRAKLTHESTMSSEQEGKAALCRYFTAKLWMDIRRAKEQTQNYRFWEAGRKWEEWIDQHQYCTPGLLAMKHREAQLEFRAIEPVFWGDIGVGYIEIEFRRVSPLVPTFTSNGTATIRFFTRRHSMSFAARIENLHTKDVVEQTEHSLCSALNGIETVMSIRFPSNGKYRVTVAFYTYLGSVRTARGHPIRGWPWRFDVSGVPPAQSIKAPLPVQNPHR
jgi:hypothetical protein